MAFDRQSCPLIFTATDEKKNTFIFDESPSDWLIIAIRNDRRRHGGRGPLPYYRRHADMPTYSSESDNLPGEKRAFLRDQMTSGQVEAHVTCARARVLSNART